MPSLLGTDVTTNYLKASPSTQFGTRELSIIKIEIANVADNTPLGSNSLFSKAVRALQQTAEVYAVGTPVSTTTDYFQAIIATDTQWDGAGTGTTAVLPSGANYTALEAAIEAGCGVAATVTLIAL
jgi:hypothetical protein